MLTFMSQRVAMSTLVASGPLTARQLADEASLSLSRARNLCCDFVREDLAERIEAEGRAVWAYQAKVSMLPADLADIEQLVACYGLEAVLDAARDS